MDVINGGWSRRRKRIYNEWPKSELENLHNERKPYVLCMGNDKDHPYCFIEINNDAMYVGFLDEMKREYLGYAFEEKKPGKLFLTEAIYWEFYGDTDDRKQKTKYFFNPNGSLQIHQIDSKTNEGEILTAKNPVDVSANWEDYPEFGHYEKLIKKERVSLTA
jgi:hypothetical protein